MPEGNEELQIATRNRQTLIYSKLYKHCEFICHFTAFINDDQCRFLFHIQICIAQSDEGQYALHHIWLAAFQNLQQAIY